MDCVNGLLQQVKAAHWRVLIELRDAGFWGKLEKIWILEPSAIMNLEMVVDNDKPGLPDKAREVGIVCEEDGAEDLGGDLGGDAAGDQPGAACVLPVQGDHGGCPV